jgi:hypothetical protein
LSRAPIRTSVLREARCVRPCCHEPDAYLQGEVGTLLMAR